MNLKKVSLSLSQKKGFSTLIMSLRRKRSYSLKKKSRYGSEARGNPKSL